MAPEAIIEVPARIEPCFLEDVRGGLLDCSPSCQLSQAASEGASILALPAVSPTLCG